MNEEKEEQITETDGIIDGEAKEDLNFSIPNDLPEHITEQINKAIDTIKTQQSMIENQNEFIALLLKEGFSTEDGGINNPELILKMLQNKLKHEKKIHGRRFIQGPGFEIKLDQNILKIGLEFYERMINKKEEKFSFVINILDKIADSLSSLTKIPLKDPK